MWAFPGGQRFEGELEVSLHAEPASTICYTFDGTSALDASAHRYTEPLVLDEDVLVSFAARGPDGRWSRQVSELYERLLPLAPFRPPERGLELSDDAIYFSARPEDRVLEREVVLRSVGLAPVAIHAVYVAAQGAYFEPGVFEVHGAGASRLSPGERLALTVRYHVTETLRTAALVIDTDGLRAPDGRWVVTLGGRVIDL